MEFATKNGIKTDETFSPGYVWYDCDLYGLEDNTQGKVGYHVVYRPLAYKDQEYAGYEVVTDEMAAETRKHYDAQREDKERLEDEQNKREWADIEAESNRETTAYEKALCPKCGSVCYGDCEA